MFILTNRGREGSDATDTIYTSVAEASKSVSGTGNLGDAVRSRGTVEDHGPRCGRERPLVDWHDCYGSRLCAQYLSSRADVSDREATTSHIVLVREGVAMAC